MFHLEVLLPVLIPTDTFLISTPLLGNASHRYNSFPKYRQVKVTVLTFSTFVQCPDHVKKPGPGPRINFNLNINTFSVKVIGSYNTTLLDGDLNGTRVSRQ